MIRLKETEIPVLGGTLMFNDKCYSIGVAQDGIIVQYIDDDSIAFLIEWKDIIDVGEKEITTTKQAVPITKPLPGQKGKRV
jgi:hypothetical protein